MAKIELKNLSIGHQKEVARCEHIKIDKGDLIFLIGRNGQGKTTLLKTLSSLIGPLGGNISIDGKEVSSLSALERSEYISIVLSDSSHLNSLKVHEVFKISCPKRIKNTRMHIDHCCQTLKIKSLLDKSFGTLSDGQKQRVLIARSLVQDTGIILLDEPTAHLDLPSALEIFEIIRNLCTHYEKTIIFSDHAIEMALLYSQKMLLVSDGLIEMNTPEDFVLSGVFSRIFCPSGFIFDSGSLRFNPRRLEGDFVDYEGPSEFSFLSKLFLAKSNRYGQEEFKSISMIDRHLKVSTKSGKEYLAPTYFELLKRIQKDYTHPS